jgi:hypothetical protein
LDILKHFLTPKYAEHRKNAEERLEEIKRVHREQFTAKTKLKVGHSLQTIR